MNEQPDEDLLGSAVGFTWSIGVPGAEASAISVGLGGWAFEPSERSIEMTGAQIVVL
jgi:hypothetical protein